MGNTESVPNAFSDIELFPLQEPLVAIDSRFVRKDEITTIRLMETSSFSKDLSFKDVVSKQVVFRSGPKKYLDRLLDAERKPLVKISLNPDIQNVYYVHRPDADSEKDDELMQIYIKQGLTTVKSYLDMKLSVDFTDMTTNRRCKIGIQGEWRARTAMLWLDRGDGQPRAAIGKVYRTKMRNGFNVDIAPNVDTSLMLLICALIDDDLKRLRQYQNGLGTWGLALGM
uniref:Tubby C-terminal domain-containing protein n=1 Tax=Globisporangium ultimum (strain ATCC 200006 / CBS 805.95 / DAOM BR144) TaxID=431595 RepID=K3WND3_GLOUD